MTEVLTTCRTERNFSSSHLSSVLGASSSLSSSSSSNPSPLLSSPEVIRARGLIGSCFTVSSGHRGVDTCTRANHQSTPHYYRNNDGNGVLLKNSGDSSGEMEGSLLDLTPVKKNKRKRSEPRKRTDFSIKRFCPESPSGGSAGSDSGRSEDSPDNSPETTGRAHDLSGRDSSHSHHSSHSSGTPPGEGEIPHPAAAGSVLHPPGMFLFPPHFPPGYMVPNIYKHHPAFLPSGTPFRRMDILNNNTPSVPMDKTGLNSQPPISSSSPTSHTPNSLHSHMDDSHDLGEKDGKKTRKNYKNMTRERRVEANARERTRVHTISAAFENLRRAVPSYSYNQKLSKLAILRIASSYIMALGKLADIQNLEDDRNKESFGQLVDVCTRTIQTEGRARRRH